MRRLSILCFLALLPAELALGASWRLDFAFTAPAERALRAAVEIPDSDERLAALVALADANPKTLESGLARVAAGLLLAAEERPAEALEQLHHPDTAGTALGDHVLLAVARAEESLDRLEPASRAYLAAANEPQSAVACVSLPAAASILRKLGALREAAEALEETVARCPAEATRALLDLGKVRQDLGDLAGAAEALDRLDREHPASDEARLAQTPLRALAKHRPVLSGRERAERALDKGEALLRTRRARDALGVLRGVNVTALPPEEANRARLLLGRAHLSQRQRKEGRRVLSGVPSESPWAAEAAWYLARDEARRTRSIRPFQTLADAFPGTSWAQRALREIANHYQKEAQDAAALPWWRRLLEEYPDGLYTETAAWRVGWGEFRAKRFAEAASAWERAARLRPPSSATPGLLYWAGRARLARGQHDHARWLLLETVQRFKHAYHGLRAREQLARLGITPAPPPQPDPDATPQDGPAGPGAERLRQHLLINTLEEAATELRRMGPSPRVRATLAWVEWRRGEFRSAVHIMRSAYPHWVSAAGDHLPREVWEILYPLPYAEELRRQSLEEGLDPSLVAAVILQESAFDAHARSRVGARGLMQIMPTTGRQIARRKGLRFRSSFLYDPKTSLDFGTFYLRQISDRFDGEVHKVLVGYNAGPHRVAAWTSLRPDLPEEEFIETIPFTETRFYVRHVLANREAYRRLYGPALGLPQPSNGGARP